jgi:hypothetical protein
MQGEFIIYRLVYSLYSYSTLNFYSNLKLNIMKIPKQDLKKLVVLFGGSEANKITYDEYINFWNKTPKQLRTL